MRASSSGAATLRVFFAAESGSRTFAATASVTDNLAKEWRLLGEYVGAVPAAPMTVTIALQPLYLAPHQQVTVSVHSDQAFGIALAVPSLVEMEREMAREARCTPFTYFTSTKVQILTPEERKGRGEPVAAAASSTARLELVLARTAGSRRRSVAARQGRARARAIPLRSSHASGTTSVFGVYTILSPCSLVHGRGVVQVDALARCVV